MSFRSIWNEAHSYFGDVGSSGCQGDVLRAFDDLKGESEGVLVLCEDVLRARTRRERLALLSHDQFEVRHLD